MGGKGRGVEYHPMGGGKGRRRAPPYPLHRDIPVEGGGGGEGIYREIMEMSCSENEPNEHMRTQGMLLHARWSVMVRCGIQPLKKREAGSSVFVSAFLAEYLSLTVWATLTATLFIGGYACPSLVPVIGLASVVLGLKASAVVFTIIWIRATLPRLTFLSVIVGCSFFLRVNLRYNFQPRTHKEIQLRLKPLSLYI